MYTSPAVMAEVKPGGKIKRWLSYLIEGGLTIRKPSKDQIEHIRKEAKRTGNYARMSETDFEILALAKELDAILLTDDYSIQNLATVVGVEYRPIAQSGITKKIIWGYRCKGCGVLWEKIYTLCPICGSKVSTVKR
jgi:UPF0271 protein